MGRHIELLILILLLKSTKEQVLFDDLDDSQQTSKESAMHFIRNELQQIRQSVMKILLQKLEDIKDELNRKISTEIENVTKTIVENITETLENKLTCFSHSTLISGMHCI